MAGQVSERVRTGEVIPQGAPRKNLSAVLYEARTLENARRWHDSLADIQDFLAVEAGGRLPDALIEQLGFGELDWQAVTDPQALPIVFLGAPNVRGEPIQLEQALGTIVIKRAEHAKDGKVFVGSVAVAGIGTTSMGRVRTQGVEYSAFNDKNAIHVDVSISPAEFPLGKEGGIFGHPPVYEIPTPLSTPEFTAGIITKAMVAATNNHTHALPANDSYQRGDTLGFHYTGWADNSPVRRGFKIFSTPYYHQIAYQPPQGVDAPGWHVNFPKQLQPR